MNTILSEYDFLLLFYTYSFLGWLLETAVATIKEKDFRNRGFVSGPFCFIYGFAAVVLTLFLNDLKGDPFFLFSGCAVMSTTIEWFTGKLLERIKLRKWWDYSHKKWNFDGYICLEYSILWGILGMAVILAGNDFLMVLFGFLPSLVRTVTLWVLTALAVIDISASLMSTLHVGIKIIPLLRWSKTLQTWTYRLGEWVSAHVEYRIARSYAPVREETQTLEKEEITCDLTQLFWLLVIGALLGDLVETIFCRITAGRWMSRSSLVWGPFSMVWGLAIAVATALLYRDRDKDDRYIFLFGTFLGGAYEYACSVFTELIFGQVFWDYSAIPFNLGGRINLLYCFFWGIAAVVWIKLLYPFFSYVIQKLLNGRKRFLTTVMACFMALNIAVSMLALIRYDSRSKGIPASHSWEITIDQHFPDTRMERIYPNAKKR